MLIFDPADSNTRTKGIPDHFTRCKDQRYMFDRVFDQYATQREVYEHTAKDLINAVMNGYNATIFAYGATGSGKTHTMIGSKEQGGIMLEAMRDLFKAIQENQDKQYTIQFSYLEVYNEQIRDLLVEGNVILELRDTPKGAVVSGLSHRTPKSAEEILELLETGNSRRAVSPTEANQVSSRSHAVMQVIVQQKERTADVQAAVNVGKLSLIDLAGSERACVTRNIGARMKEGANINKSLLALGNCINALGEGNGKNKYVPYRNSKLTRLLKDSLGGNCRTVMITTVSPSSLSYEDTLNTLKYANRAKNIRTKVSRNVVNVKFHVAQYKNIVVTLRKEVAQLKNKLSSVEVERDQLLAGMADSTRNKAKEQKEEAALSQLLAKIRENFAERTSLKRNLLELQEQEKENDLTFRKKKAAIAGWELNPKRGTSGVFTPPQIAKMRQEVGVMTHNTTENRIKQSNLNKRLEKSLQDFEELQKQTSMLIDSPHKRKLLQSEETIQELTMANRQLMDKLKFDQQLLHAKDQRINELENLVRDQFLTLKEHKIATEKHAYAFTTVTGEVLLTPRRAPSGNLLRTRQGQGGSPTVAASPGQHVYLLSPAASRGLSSVVPPMPSSTFGLPRSNLMNSFAFMSSSSECTSVTNEGSSSELQTTSTALETPHQLQNVDAVADVVTPFSQHSGGAGESSPFSSPKRPRSILKKKTGSRRRNGKKVTISDVPCHVFQEPQDQAQASSNSTNTKVGFAIAADGGDGASDDSSVSTSTSEDTHFSEGPFMKKRKRAAPSSSSALSSSSSKPPSAVSTSFSRLLAPTVASQNRTKMKNASITTGYDKRHVASAATSSMERRASGGAAASTPNSSNSTGGAASNSSSLMMPIRRQSDWHEKLRAARMQRAAAAAGKENVSSTPSLSSSSGGIPTASTFSSTSTNTTSSLCSSNATQQTGNTNHQPPSAKKYPHLSKKATRVRVLSSPPAVAGASRTLSVANGN
ncbi:Kinesin-like protein kif18a, variant 2 [Balamuthia mandrillaris]